MTKAEHILWQTLRRKSTGFYFRRQVPIGGYIADFARLKSRLVVEVDGGRHYDEEQAAYDSARTSELRTRGFEVMRVTNRDVHTNMDGVFRAIVDKLARVKS